MRTAILLACLFFSWNLKAQTTDELNQQAIEFSKRGDSKRALDNIDRSLKIDPRKKETYFTYGGILLGKNDLKAAEEKLLRAIELDSSYAEPYDYLSIIYYQSNDLTRTLMCFDKSISIEPTVQRLQGRADIKGMLRDYEGAIRDCDEIIRTEPQNPSAFFTRGNSKFGLKDKDGACADLTRAIELGRPKDAFFSKYCEN
jgi:tetratricopeptide (TPR) repeat protein